MVHNDFWVSILNRLKPTIKKAHFLTWFENTAVLSKDDGNLVVGVPTNFAENWISTKYKVKILQAAQEIDSAIKEIDFKVDGKLVENSRNAGVDVKKVFSEQFEKKVRKVRNVNQVKLMKPGSMEAISSEMLNSKYRLDNFVVGVDNRLPHAACNAVSNMPGGIYNPLYIYGSVGLGKTHLLQSIGNQVLNSFPDLVVQYMTAERFVTEVVEAIGKRYMKRFKERYRNVDVFLIDDIQFFARKDSSQQEFFHTFNELYNANKQVVLTSDRPPSELDHLDERLKSRFSMGMVVELVLPDFETKLAILHEKCKEFELILDPEVLSFIATNVHNSVRELEGVLRQAMAESQLFDKVPTIRSVAEIIKRMNKAQEIIGFDIEAKQKNFVAKTMKDVTNVVAEYYNVTVDQLVGKDRHRNIMVPRQVCMYLIKKELNESYERIGADFGGRNHTTVMHACSKTAKKLRTDLRLVRDINAIKREMGM
jgi:chromosomal replication initiator protein